MAPGGAKGGKCRLEKWLLLLLLLLLRLLRLLLLRLLLGN
jgi:hypothetical protein